MDRGALHQRPLELSLSPSVGCARPALPAVQMVLGNARPVQRDDVYKLHESRSRDRPERGAAWTTDTSAPALRSADGNREVASADLKSAACFKNRQCWSKRVGKVVVRQLHRFRVRIVQPYSPVDTNVLPNTRFPGSHTVTRVSPHNAKSIGPTGFAPLTDVPSAERDVQTAEHATCIAICRIYAINAMRPNNNVTCASITTRHRPTLAFGV